VQSVLSDLAHNSGPNLNKYCPSDGKYFCIVPCDVLNTGGVPEVVHYAGKKAFLALLVYDPVQIS
jgi:hypothetical protein